MLACEKKELIPRFFVTHSHTQVQRTTNIELSYKELTFFILTMTLENLYH